MAAYNRVILVGNVTRDVEVKYIPSGSAVCELNLAVNRTWFDKQSNQKKEAVDFIGVTLWGRLAEIAGDYCKKGRSVLIEGRISNETYEDKQTQKTVTKTKVVGETMQLLGGGNGERQSAPAKQQAAPSSDAGFDTGSSVGGDSLKELVKLETVFPEQVTATPDGLLIGL